MSFLDEQQTSYEGQTFKKADASQRTLQGIEFYQCKFINCQFTEAILGGCKFIDCTFENCQLPLVQVVDSTFHHAEFTDCTLIGIDWTRAIWNPLSSVAFHQCNLSHSSFMGLTFKRQQIIDCEAINVDFTETELTEANFDGTNFSEARFIRTNLKKADFSGAKNYFIDVTLNEVKDAKFSLPEAINLLRSLEIELVEN